MFCRFFILRPVLSIVISLIMVIAGGLAIWASPVSQYPDITPPSIRISATFPGATSATLAAAVAAPLEDQISGVANMIYMTSSSANASNQVSISIYFNIGTNLNEIQSDVLNRINTAMPMMPLQVQQQGVTVRKASPDLFLVVNFYTEGYPDIIYLSNYVYRYVYPVVSQINGVGLVNVVGNRNFAMRVWMDPKKLAYYNIATSDVVAAIKDQNAPFAIGLMGMPPTNGKSQFQFMINTQGYLTDVKQFENIIIRANQQNNQIVRLKDIAKVTLDGQQYMTNVMKVEHTVGGGTKVTPSTALLLYLTPGANQLETKQRIDATIKKLEKHFPAGIKYYYHYDASVFVDASIHKVVETFRDAFILVFLVVFIFIQNIRGTIIPILAIPVSIIGAFAGIYMLGYSINTLTLFGVILAIGIVVDDAIVVLENVERIMEEDGLDSTAAAIRAMEEVASPVIAIVLVLNAVFIPVAFLGGFAGMLYQQFAVTIAISVFLSGIVALTLTPTLCAIFLKNKPKDDRPKWKGFIWFDHGFAKVKNTYLAIVEFLIDRSKLAYALFVIVIGTTIGLYMIIPTSLMPLEDMGYYYTSINLPAAASLDRSTNQAIKLATYLTGLQPTYRNLIIAGLDILDNGALKTNAAFIVGTLKPWEERKQKSQQIDAMISKTNAFGYMNKGANYLAFNSPPIRGLSTSGGVTFYLQAASSEVTVEKIYKDSLKLVAALKEYPAVGFATQFYDLSVPQLYVDLDRDKAKLYGVNIGDVFLALQSIYGTYYVNYFQKWNDLWWVILQSDYKFRDTPELLNTVFVKSAYSNQMLPIGSMAKVTFKTGPEVVTRYNDYLASQLIANPKPGYTTGDVMAAISDAVPKILGGDYQLQWFGPAYQQAQTGASSSIALVMGIVMVFLILAALYELWGLPFSILMAMPFSLFGAAIALLLSGRPNDIFFQVSLITLIGLSAKNAILIVEFALEGIKEHNMSPRDAALEGARLRFRPIVMTSLAFILGALPLALANGAGANSQHSVGTGIIGGMIGSTFLATLFVPLFFTSIMNWRLKSQKKDGVNVPKQDY
ncbi:MAG: hydrophobe/amphiphile efflux family transporter [Burkholderiales bacterium]|nr:hydrophobe/amphiphile efflux family transporter [Burkholderiales bacterium]